MEIHKEKSLHYITLAVIVLGIISSAVGLLYTTGGQPYNFTNQYGDIIKIQGDGLYKHDSYFMASIFKGTDFTILFFAIPVLIISLITDMKKKTTQSRLFLTSMIALFCYYSISIAFGVTYNFLHLVYIALFSTSFFGLILAIASIDRKQIIALTNKVLPYKGIYIFLAITAIALFAAWLPDIIGSLLAGKSLGLIEVYTTCITYVLDMGILSPVAVISLYKIKKRDPMGYILLEMMLTLCMFVGIMMITQTVYQFRAGIELPIAAVITKSASFVILALFALYFNIALLKKPIKNI